MANDTATASANNEVGPDMLDLNDWAVIHAPESYAVAKYLNSVEGFYNTLHAAWIAAGKPEI